MADIRVARALADIHTARVALAGSAARAESGCTAVERVVPAWVRSTARNLYLPVNEVVPAPDAGDCFPQSKPPTRLPSHSRRMFHAG